MGKSGGSGGDSTTTVRFAPYIEDQHRRLIDKSLWFAAEEHPDAQMYYLSPYANYTVINPDDAFLGLNAVISDFDSIYAMFATYQKDLDIDSLWVQAHQDTAYGQVISEIVDAESAFIDDDIDIEVAKMKAGMRDMGAVMSTGYMNAEANIRDTGSKVKGKLRSDLRAKFTDLGQRRWEQKLNWDLNIVTNYLKINEDYFKLRTDYLATKAEIDTHDLLWPFTIMDHEAAILGCITGAKDSKVKGHKPGVSGAIAGGAAGALGGAAMGAYAGAQIGAAGGGITALGGAAIGGLIGLAGGLFGGSN